MYRLLLRLVTLHFVYVLHCVGFVLSSEYTEIVYLNTVNKLTFVMVRCSVLFAVRTPCLNII